MVLNRSVEEVRERTSRISALKLRTVHSCGWVSAWKRFRIKVRKEGSKKVSDEMPISSRAT